MAMGMSSRPRRLRRAVLCGVATQCVEQRQVARLRLEREVEQVADDRHHADERIERDVAEHVQLNRPAARSDCARRCMRVDRDQRAGDVAEAGHQAEQRIEAEAPLRAGNGERLVEQHA